MIAHMGGQSEKQRAFAERHGIFLYDSESRQGELCE